MPFLFDGVLKFNQLLRATKHSGHFFVRRNVTKKNRAYEAGNDGHETDVENEGSRASSEGFSKLSFQF